MGRTAAISISSTGVKPYTEIVDNSNYVQLKCYPIIITCNCGGTSPGSMLLACEYNLGEKELSR